MSPRWTLRVLWVVVFLLVVSTICFLLSLFFPGGNDTRALIIASLNCVVIVIVGRMAVQLKSGRGR